MAGFSPQASALSEERARYAVRCAQLSCATAAALLVLPGTAHAQHGARQPAPVFQQTRWVASDSGPPTWMPPAASAIVPGSGQLLARKDRGVVYLAVEVLLLSRFFSLQTEGRRESDQFRELAFTVARAPFVPTIRDTVFEYFEHMEKFIDSGPFDTNAGPTLVPADDERTFNGSIWALARRTFFANPDSTPDTNSPEYVRALNFYRQRAVGPNFAWSWRNAGLEQDLFRQSIRESDEAFRGATRQLGLLLANHLLSALDAFITQRLSRNGRQVEVASMLGVPRQDGSMQGLMMVRVGF